MQEIPGQRPGSRFFQHEDGFLYHVDVRYLENRWICTSRTTGNRYPVELQCLDDGRLQLVGDRMHTYVAPPHAAERRTFISALHEPALQVPGLLQAYEDVCRRYPAFADSISRAAGLAHIRNVRRKRQPDVPATMAGLGVMLANYLPAAPIFQEHIEAEDGSFIIVFACDEMINQVDTAPELHLSCSSPCIDDVPASQLLILFLRKKDLGIPSIYVIFEHRNIIAYAALWQFLIRRAPGMREHLHTVVCECDDFLISSLCQEMEWIRIRFSLVHFIKIITRKWYNLGLPRHNPPNAEPLWVVQPKILKVLGLAWALLLIDEVKFEAGVDDIDTYSQRFVRPEDEMIVVFIRHLRQWVEYKNIISVRRFPARNNDKTEGFNVHLPRILRNQGILSFIGRLLSIIAKFEENWVKIGTEQLLVHRPKQDLHNNQIVLQQVTAEISETPRLQVLKFLQSAIPRDFEQNLPFIIYRPARAP